MSLFSVLAVSPSFLYLYMANAFLWGQEYPPVKFILRCFEHNYPECLGIMLIHNAPRAFSGQ